MYAGVLQPLARPTLVDSWRFALLPCHTEGPGHGRRRNCPHRCPQSVAEQRTGQTTADFATHRRIHRATPGRQPRVGPRRRAPCRGRKAIPETHDFLVEPCRSSPLLTHEVSLHEGRPPSCSTVHMSVVGTQPGEPSHLVSQSQWQSLKQNLAGTDPLASWPTRFATSHPSVSASRPRCQRGTLTVLSSELPRK